MRKIILVFIVVYSCSALSKVADVVSAISPLQVHNAFVNEYTINVTGLFDIADKDEKLLLCTQDYIKKQSKSYLKVAQGNLYNLINNFDNLVSKIYGKKGLPDNIPYEEKIELLAKVQCEAYFKMGVLK